MKEEDTGAQSLDELMQRITEGYDSLPRQLKSVASYLEGNRANVMMDRTSDIADACGVHPSAVVRFAQRFGFAGFSELQAIFKSAYAADRDMSPSYQQRIRNLIESTPGKPAGAAVARAFIAASRAGLDDLQESLDENQFEAAVSMLESVENIYVMGFRRSFAVASYIVYALQHTPKRVHLVSGFGGMYQEQIRSLKRDDVLVAISFAPYAQETQWCVQAAHQAGARILLITDSQLSPLVRFATAHLFVKEGSAFAFRSLTSTICLCQALFIELAYRLELRVEETTRPRTNDH